MKIVDIVKYPNPVLRQPCDPLTTIDDDVRAVIAAMFELMYASGGVGLSAPQVGLSVQLFVVNRFGKNRRDKEMVFINPTSTLYGSSASAASEGCLSMPGVKELVMRADSFTFDALDLSGKLVNHVMGGLTGRICQHEYDHLCGVLFIDKVISSERERVAELVREFEEANSSIGFSYHCKCECGCTILVPPDGPSYCSFCLKNPQKHKPPEL